MKSHWSLDLPNKLNAFGEQSVIISEPKITSQLTIRVLNRKRGKSVLGIGKVWPG